MPKPNVHMRVRSVGWVSGQITGSAVNNSGTGIAHGNLGNLAAGARADSYGFQVNNAITGGAAAIYIGNTAPPAFVPTASVPFVHDSHAVYCEVFVHLRSAGNVDLPGVLSLFTNELPPAAGNSPGDWRTGDWVEWEKWSPLTIPTPPPGFSSGGAAGIRYEYRRVLGRVPGNFMFVGITNAGSVAATEWGVGLILRDQG